MQEELRSGHAELGVPESRGLGASASGRRGVSHPLCPSWGRHWRVRTHVHGRDMTMAVATLLFVKCYRADSHILIWSSSTPVSSPHFR